MANVPMHVYRQKILHKDIKLIAVTLFTRLQCIKYKQSKKPEQKQQLRKVDMIRVGWTEL